MNIPFVWSCALVNTSIYSSYVGIVMMLSLHTVSCNLIFWFLFTLHFSALLFIIIRQFYLFISCVFIKMKNSIVFTRIVAPMEQFIVLRFLYQIECFEAGVKVENCYLGISFVWCYWYFCLFFYCRFLHMIELLLVSIALQTV